MKNKIILLLLIFFSFSFVSAKEMIETESPDIGVYVFKINTKKYGDKIKPYIATDLTTSKKVYDDKGFNLVVNGGFFDVKTGNSVSFVKIDSKQYTDVVDNVQLTKSLKAQNRLNQVISRTEFRVLENKRHKLKFDIARHTDEIKKGYVLKHALQAGPMILPTMDLVGEGFVIKEEGIVKFQSVDILKRRERTAIGLKGKYLYIILFTKDYRVDANEMQDYVKEKLKLKKVMALDGGLSTSLNYKNISIGSLGKYQRRVKSFLIIER